MYAISAKRGTPTGMSGYGYAEYGLPSLSWLVCSTQLPPYPAHEMLV
jgi:hypothetical protein